MHTKGKVGYVTPCSCVNDGHSFMFLLHCEKKAKLKVKSYAILTKQYLILPNYLFSIKNHYAYKIYLHEGRCSIACGYSIICKLFKCYAYSIESKRGKIVHEW